MSNIMFLNRSISHRFDRTFCASLSAVGLLVLILFYMASSYLPPMSLNLRVEANTINFVNVDKQSMGETPSVGQYDGGEKFYGIIFDAGSTGSRIHIFELKKVNPDTPAELVKETFKAIKPGLSMFALHPKEGVQTLKPLLDFASKTIPEQYHEKTLIALKATAGLRLLSEDTANSILREVRNLFGKYDFLFHDDDDDISIMKGTDEGMYMWVTVNFLLGALTGKTHKVAAMDLGGGSTQVTFVPTDSESFKNLPQRKIKNIRLFNKTYQLYSHSYLGLGLMVARLGSMGHTTKPKAESSPTLNILESPCLPANYVGNWSFQNTDLIMKGLDEKLAGFDNCYPKVREFIKRSNITAIPDLCNHQVYIFSYYFDRAVDGSIIKPDYGGKITPLDYKKAANFICKGYGNRKKPFLCFDLTYIYSLLTDGFGLSPDSTLYIYKRIKNFEMSWALGSMFGLMSNTKHNDIPRV